MLARIAHELFWLGRNLVRAEHTARMLDGVFQADLQARPEDPSVVNLSWGALLHIMGGATDNGELPHRDAVLGALTLDPENPASVVACVTRAREGGRAVRDVISAEMWESLNTMNLTLREGDLSARLRIGPYSVYQYVKERSALFWGLTARTMLRDEASAFLEAGGRMEAGDMVLRMLRVGLPVAGSTGASDGQALALLQAVGGFQAFRRAVPAPAHAAPVAHFLLFERAYPDSVAAAVDALQAALERADASPRESGPVLRLSRLSADLEFRRRAQADDTDLVATCETVQRELGLVDRDVAERYFAGAAGPLS
jgi:uncharacterized alpha-E superfamily protein